MRGYHEGDQVCIRDERWSFIERPEGQADELYLLAEDPHEQTNLVDRFPDEARRLSTLFGAYWRRKASRYVKGIQERYEVASGNIE